MATQRYLLDQYGNTLRTVEYDQTDPTGRIVTVAEQECDNIVASCARDAEIDQGRGHLRHAARIPVEVLNRAAREGWLHDKLAWKRWLNDGSNAHFRTWRGTV